MSRGDSSQLNSTRLRYEGCNFFRQRLVLATLSCRPVSIVNIRFKENDPGLREFEASFIRLLDKITNGSKIEVNETGTAVHYEPGLLYGGTIEHDCCTLRSISYYLEPLLAVGPFCKMPLNLTLRGVTNDQIDPSIDVIRCSSIPILKRFLLVDDGLMLKIFKRGAPPKGGGEVIFTCPIRKQLRPLQYVDPGKIKKIRGVSYALRTSPTMTNRMIEAAKGVLLKYIPDVFILTDHRKGPASGLSPGFGITLTAETINGTFLSAEATSSPQGDKQIPSVAEELGERAALLLLEEIYRGGCVDSSNQHLVLLLMALGPKDVSRVQLGPLSPYTIQFLRHLRDFFGTVFKMETENKNEEENLRIGTEKILMTCVGIGTFLSAEATSSPQGDKQIPSVAEELGERAALLLLEEIYRGGCVDSSNQHLVLLLMALGPKDVSRVQLGPLSPYTIQFLRHLRDFFGTVFKMETENKNEEENLRIGTEKILMTCVGIGYTNLSKTMT
uniref:EOG090X05X4 n=1 Tax=Ceriodaphnia reticulata TaxID=302197 RepID=A0A4Y7LZQ8_9CRUS|nr:EOG090X05X4 [Ceriodaphnia reticulata]SVE72929.1 EOG090X05X4 [Ceriodaphnia reticulata]